MSCKLKTIVETFRHTCFRCNIQTFQKLKSVYYNENMSAMKICPWINQSCVLTRKFKNFFAFHRLTMTSKKFWIFVPIHNFYWFREEFSCFRCNIQIFSKIANFTHNYLENYNDSEAGVNTKNAPLLMNFPNNFFIILTSLGFRLSPLKNILKIKLCRISPRNQRGTGSFAFPRNWISNEMVVQQVAANMIKISPT